MMHLFPLSLLLFVLTFGAHSAVAQPVVSANREALSLEQLQTKKSAIEVGTALDSSAKAKVIELYDQALNTHVAANEIHTRIKTLNDKIAAAPKRVEQIRKLMEKPLAAYSPVKKLPKKAEINEIETLLRQEEKAFDLLREALKQHTDELTRQLTVTTTLSQESADRSSRLERIESDLKTPAPPGEPTALTEARYDALLARKKLRQTELDLYRLQLDNNALLTSLAMAERDLAVRESNHRLPGLEALRNAAQQLRETIAAEVKEKAELAQEKAVGLPGAIHAIAEKNVALSSELEKLTRKESQVSARLDAMFLQLEEIKTEANNTRQRVEIVGPSEAIGRMLRKRRDALPSLESYRRDADKRRAEINRATDRQIDIEESRRDLLDLDQLVEQTVADFIPQLTEKESAQLPNQARQLLLSQRDTLTELHRIYGRYISQLTALDVAERQLITEAEKFTQFIGEHLIWIRSTPPVALADVARFPAAVIWLVSPGGWLQVSKDLLSAVGREPGRSLFGLLIVIALFVLRRHAVRTLLDIAQKTKKFHTDSFLLTLQALWHTAVLSAARPAAIAFVAWLLNTPSTADPFTAAVSSGLYASATMLAAMSFFWQLCRPEGVAERHFRWPGPIRRELLRELRWLIFAIPPLVFVITATTHFDQESLIQGLGRPAFFVMMLAICLFALRVFRPTGALTMHLLDRMPGSSWARLRFTWFSAAILLPLSAIVVSAFGYHYTALTMERYVELTLWLFLGVWVLKDLLLRSIYLVERRLRYREAVRKRDELRAQREREAVEKGGEMTPLVELPEIEYEEVNYEQLGEQAKRLLQTGLLLGLAIGLWNIWADLLPAFHILDAVQLPFTATELIDGVEKTVPITLADLGLALLLLLITFIATKNLPGVLEFGILQRLPLDSGARYAIKALSQYLIVAIGIIAAFNTIGAEWSSIQWLVAALGVGLGFGLQEIVANFISGIILLFERPIRVGDTVTVGETTGKVSRIRIRATTILSWDKQELLVPNKEFITNRLLNWTLTDQTLRLLIPVGIAYGSDVERALQLLAETAAENPHVLEDPASVVTFDQFGDNSLILTLRVYIGSLEHRLDTITEIHRAINQRFNEAGIVIAFPQRDIHLDTSKPLDIRISRAPAGGGLSP